MNKFATTIIKEKKLVLPLSEKMWAHWNNRRVIVVPREDDILIKKIQPSFWNTWKQIKPHIKNITKADIKKAVSWARSEKAG